jgi:CMP-N-acetylneuraminic acid synthetase
MAVKDPGTPRIVALIPARGGSKGVKRKNLRDLAGKPLLRHTVDAAKACSAIDGIYLSSEDTEILAAGEGMGCMLVPRPPALAHDESSANDVVFDFFAQVPLADDDVIFYLQPTSPLRTGVHLDEAIATMLAAGAEGLVAVTELEKSPYKAFCVDAQGHLESLFGEKYSNYGRQQLPRTYIPNGAIYIFRKKFFVERGGFPSNGSLPYIMSKADSVDIDTESDLELAGRMMEQRNDRI